MNLDFLYKEGKKNQLEYWESNQIINKFTKEKNIQASYLG
jgi:hypothetical protein